MNKRRWIQLVAVAVMALAGGAWWALGNKEGGHTTVLPPLAQRPTGGDFTLQTADGALSLHDLRGKVVLLYFGYTNCPDVCPASISAGSQALTQLSAQERANTRLLFVSVDPARDTPAKLKEYAAYFHPEMIGATGTPEQVAAVAGAYGASYVRQPARADGGYAVDHSAQTYVIAPDGRLAEEVEYGASAAKVMQAVRRHLP